MIKNGLDISSEIFETKDALEKLEMDASGMLDLLTMMATAEESEGNEEISAGTYLLGEVQEHFVQSLRDVIKTLGQKIAADRKSN